MIKVRFATRADIEVMADMGQALHDESPRFASRSYSKDKVMRLGEHLLGTMMGGPRGCMLIAEKGDEPIGMMVGFVTEDWFGHDKVASDYTFYVKPEHRGGRAAVMLLKTFEQWAREQGAVEIMPGVSTLIHEGKTQRFYEKLGYRFTGVLLSKKVE